MSTELSWKANTHARQDVEEALRRLGAGEGLTARQWAAWVWYETGRETNGQCKNAEGVAIAFAYEANGKQDTLRYMGPARLARKGSVWYQASGGRMPQWCLLLEDPHFRRLALMAAGALHEEK